MNIEIISGSERKNSLTSRIALYLKNYLQIHTNHDINIIDARDYHFPHLSEVWGSVEKAPDEFKDLATSMFAADAFILVSPEYNGSYSPALKNILDHFPKQNRKPFAIATGSPGAMGGIRASQQMQLLVGALFGILAPNMLITPQVDRKFDENGNLLEASFEKNVHHFIQEFTWLAESLVPKLEPTY